MHTRLNYNTKYTTTRPCFDGDFLLSLIVLLHTKRAFYQRSTKTFIIYDGKKILSVHTMALNYLYYIYHEIKDN